MNKKGTEFMAYLAVFIVIIIITVIVNLYGKYQEYKEQIGTSQFYLMNAYENGEKVLAFVDSSLSEGFMATVYNGSKTGFIFDNICAQNPDEKNYYGYRKINSVADSCASSVSDAIKQDFENRFESYLKSFSEMRIPYPGYKFYLIKKNNAFDFVAIPDKRLKIEIKSPSEGKCCVTKTGTTTTTTEYFIINEGECKDLNPINLGGSILSIRYLEADAKNCENLKWINIGLEGIAASQNNQ